MPYLIVKTNTSGYNLYYFVSNISIGRHSRNDIMLNSDKNNTISRRHAVIRQDGDGYVLFDCSLNGTCIKNELIKKYRLRHGDQFQIADAIITFIDDTAVESEHKRRLTNGVQLSSIDDDTVAEPIYKHLSAQDTQPSSAYRNKKTEKVMSYRVVDEDLSDIELKRSLKTTGIIVEDEQMLSLYRDIQTISHVNVPILIMGESGTGKEKVAQAIHEVSEASGKFVAVNCSAIPESLFENELFGSKKGAFSDAQTKSGKFEIAENGTLFLDEIGDMGLISQPKLLRFLETRSISRLGETRVRNLNLRIVAATNQDLNGMIKRQAFRRDLFQRLACIKLNIPPLRKRKRDILPLANFFLAEYARQYGLRPLEISSQASQIMLSYHWPGNVRELSNIMLNVSVRVRGRKIMPAHLTSASEEMEAFDIGVGTDFVPLRVMEKNHIHNALKQSGNNKTKACAMLGISRGTLYKKIHVYNIR
jgi:transcriptional regulator with PAS, ATPase and Fis domain